jgi:hypothetical protein
MTARLDARQAAEKISAISILENLTSPTFLRIWHKIT